MSEGNPRKVILPVVIILVAGAIAFALVKLKPVAPKRPAHIPRPVVAVYEVPDTAPAVRVRGFGTVVAKRSIDVTAQVSGEVVARAESFNDGGFFRAGDVLLEIEDTDYVLAVERGQSEVARARYNLATAEEEAEVARREWEQIRSRSDDNTERYGEKPNPLVLREPQLALARAELSAAEASLEQARVNLRRCKLTAPFDGRVLSANIDAGQYIRAGSPLGSIYATDVAEITVSIPDADLAWISVPLGPEEENHGARADVRAEFRGDLHHWEGRVVRLGGAIDSGSRQVPVVIEVDEPYRRDGDRPPLVAGMFVEVVFAADAPEGAVVIPRTGLRPGNKVWIVGEDARIEIRPVNVARAGVEEAIIADGLAPGEEICTSNLQYVTDGMEVRIVGRATPDANSTAAAGGEQR